MDKASKIIVTGASGLVGTALVNLLHKNGYENVTGASSDDCDLRDYPGTLEFFEKVKPDHVFHLAGSVYGIMGNMNNKGSQYLDNLLMNTNTIEASRAVGVRKTLCMSTGAVYPFPPKSMPLKEAEMWEGEPHSSEDSYAHAKRVMLAQLQAYKESYGMKFAYVISCNLFGPGDRFNINDGHVIPSLVRKFSEAKDAGKPVEVWGSGKAVRDFLFSEDTASALLLIMEKFEGSINIGSGREISIKDIVDSLSDISGINDISWDATKPDGQLKRMYDLTRLDEIGFRPQYSFKEALKLTYEWFIINKDNIRQ